jgi:hypothetical protein
MMGPPSSRSVDPRLASASGVMRDTVGAIHNLQHLLGSVRVGPKALARVIPDVHASCGPMIVAAGDLVLGAASRGIGAESVKRLGELVTTRMNQLAEALGSAKKGALRASDRLHLETAIAEGVKDLDGSLELVELMVEASASGSVPVDVMDVLRETAIRADTGSGRGRRLRVTHTAPEHPILVRVNPRLAVRLLAFAAAIAAGRDAGVHVEVAAEASMCRLGFRPPAAGSDGLRVAIPPLIELSERCVAEVARSAGTALMTIPEECSSVVLFPLAPSD